MSDISNIKSDIENTLDKVIAGTVKGSEKIKKSAENVINEVVETTDSFIADASYKIDSALDFSSLSNDDVNNLAKKIYSYNQTSTSNTSSNNAETKEDEKTLSNIAQVIAGETWEGIFKVTDWVGDKAEKGAKIVDKVFENVGDFVQNLDGDAKSRLGGLFLGITSAMADGMKNYKDGVSETSFGSKMEESWHGGSTTAFLDYFKKKNSEVAAESKRINILSSTPLDSGNNRESLYGTMMLGAPFLFNEYSDPTNRTLINSLIKDGKFVTFTPGMPKFNGTSYNSTGENNILKQTKNPEEMLQYLAKNGLDADFSNKDKRYYTFKTDYKAYFAYLETMLNVIWVKLGLAKDGNTFNLFSFFKIKKDGADGIDPDKYEELIEKYNSSIGFFTNPASSVSESVDSQTSTDGDDLASRANDNAAAYQRINYITGMGTGSAMQNASRKIGIAITSAQGVKEFMGSSYQNTISAFGNISSIEGRSKASTIAKKILGTVKAVGTAVADTSTLLNTNDLGAVVQSFATSNGMMVKYPNLWSNTEYSKNINFNFTFTSPYGDPLSIFKYVYVPFCALACFALPRQAAENGYVSPFLVRCDVPGLITSDLALISSFTWTKGGSNSLWTKDGLPRSIDVTLTVNDLYPYLAMSKRISFLSANPSYAVFLDSMCGMLSLNDSSDSDDYLDSYFKELLQRVNGESDRGMKMWNKFNSTKSTEIKKMSESVRSSLSATVDPHSVPWLHNSSLS